MDGRNEDRLWTAEEVGAYLGFHPQTVYAKSRLGQIPALKIGRALRFKPADIRKWAEQNSKPATSGEAA
jgi:excisionase family DNA binding protein